jgi:hypothetical protein
MAIGETWVYTRQCFLKSYDIMPFSWRTCVDTYAYMWTNLAAAQELEKAVNMRDNLVKVMTPSQIEEGQKLVREWIDTHSQAAQ